MTDSTWTKIVQLAIPSAGTYIAIARVRFDKNANGSRAVNISTTSASSVIQNNSKPNENSVITQIQCSYPFTCTGATTIYLNAWQSSGGKLNVFSGAGTEMRLIRVSY